MYQNYFGFKEPPFRLVPDPAYLFLSKSHEEALSHLNYAVSRGDGFVLITGEVGTGKTTLCRAFLESLSNHTKAAYIFNPKMDSIQLLKFICDEFNITSEADNTKELIDNINAFLMAEKVEGNNVILLIDEAHNLAEEVLEQIRLLSNLETTRHKLLQIILVGQPELNQILNSQKLRQLGQRITLSCHLKPLNLQETIDYIQHRIAIASLEPVDRITQQAMVLIYKYSGGTPRLINIACDRSLIVAYGNDDPNVTKSGALVAIRELTGETTVAGDRPMILRINKKIAGIAIAAAVVVVLLLITFYLQPNSNNEKMLNQLAVEDPKDSLHKRSKTFSPNSSKSRVLLAKDDGNISVISDKAILESSGKRVSIKEKGFAFIKPVILSSQNIKPISLQDFEFFLKAMKKKDSMKSALKAALSLWLPGDDINPSFQNFDDEKSIFRLAAKEYGFLMEQRKSDLSIITGLNLPAILKFRIPGEKSAKYLTIGKIQKGVITFVDENGITSVKSSQIKAYWTGDIFMPWRNFSEIKGVIPKDYSKGDIITLKILLQKIGFHDIEINSVYNEKTKTAIELIQTKYGIEVDGIVGSTTKIAIYNEMNTFDIPHLTDNEVVTEMIIPHIIHDS